MANETGACSSVHSGSGDGRSSDQVPGRTETPTGSSAPARMATRRLEGAGQSVTAALLRGQAGQSMVEYAIVLFLVAVVAMVAVRALGQGVDEVFRSILESFRTVLPQGGGF